MLEPRLQAIRHHLYTHGFASIETLVGVLGASPATVRRDLSKLEGLGIVRRSHGGARLQESQGLEVAFRVRESQALERKRAIGGAAHATLRPGSTVLMDAGTTVLQLARAIRVNPLPLAVITNGLAVAQELVGIDGINVTLLGGQLRNDNLSSVGPYAERLLEEFWCDQLFLGTTAINAEGDLMTLDANEAAINRKMLERAGERLLLCDSGKFGHRGPYRVAHLTQVSRVITDDDLEPVWHERLERLKVPFERVRAAERVA